MNPHEFSTRRQTLLGLGAAALGLCSSPLKSFAASDDALMLTRKRLLLFTLYGGNDGLNTLVPYRDPLYAQLRPTLALDTKTLLPVSDEVALHARMTEVMNMFQAGEVAVIQDVGYPNPNLSHFDSIAVWDSAQPAREQRGNTGWFGELAMRNKPLFNAARFDAAVVSFDQNTGFAQGDQVPILQADRNAFDLTTHLERITAYDHAPQTVRRLADMINQGIDVNARFAARLKGIARPQWQPYEEPLDVQTKLTEWMINSGVTTPMLALAQDGFDTHAGLLERHDERLHTIDAGLAALRRGLKANGTWNDTVIMVHSEFGRRVAENGFGGTDHGTASPVFLIGGKVKGGIYGQRALLDDLDHDGNLKFTTDYRRVYSTLAANLWQLPANPFAEAGFEPLGALG